MIHPSYYELMEKMNEVNAEYGGPKVTSRYSVVLATSKRARQLTDGAEPKVHIRSPKLLSTAVDEFYEGLVRLVDEDAADNLQSASSVEEEKVNSIPDISDDEPEEETEEASYDSSDEE